MATKPMAKRGPYPEALARVGHYKCRTQSKFLERRLMSEVMIVQVRVRNKEIQLDRLRAKVRDQNEEDQNMDEGMDDGANTAGMELEIKEIEQEHIRSLESQISQIEDDNLRLQSMVANLKEDRGDLASEEDSRDEVIETLENEVEELKKQLAEGGVGPAFAAMERQIEELKQSKKKAIADYKEAEETSRDAQASVQDHRDQIKVYLKQIEKYKQKEKDRKDPDLRQNVANLQQKLVETSDHIATLEVHHHRGEERVRNLEKLIETRDNEKRSLERELEQVNKRLGTETETTTLSLDERASTIATHEKTIKKQQNTINQLNVELQKMQNLVAQHVQNAVNIATQRDEAAVGGKVLLDQLQDSRNEIARLQEIEQQYQSVSANLESLNAMVDKLYADRGDRNSLLISDLLSEGRAAIDLLKDVKKEVRDDGMAEYDEEGDIERMVGLEFDSPRDIAMDQEFDLYDPQLQVQGDEMDIDDPMDGTVQMTTAGIQETTTAPAHSSTQTIAQAPAAKAPAAKAPDVKAPDVKAPGVKAPAAKAPDVKAPEVKAADVKAPAPKAPDVKAPDGKAADVKAPDVKASDVKAPAAKAPDVKAPAVKAPDGKAADVKAPDVKAPAAKAPDVKAPAIKAPDGKTPAVSSTADEAPAVIPTSTSADSSIQTSTQSPAVKGSPATESVTVEGSAGNSKPAHADSSVQATTQTPDDTPTAVESTPVEAPTVKLTFKVPEKSARATAPPAAPKTSAVEPTAKAADNTIQGTTQIPAMNPTSHGSSVLSNIAGKALATFQSALPTDAAAKDAAMKPKFAYADSSTQATAQAPAAQSAPVETSVVRPKPAYADSSTQAAAPTLAVKPTVDKPTAVDPAAAKGAAAAKPKSAYADGSAQVGPVDLKPSAILAPAVLQPAPGKLKSTYVDSSPQTIAEKPKPAQAAPAITKDVPAKPKSIYADSSTQIVDKPKPIYADSSTQIVDKPKPIYADSSAQTVDKPKPIYADSSTQTVDKPKPVYVDSSTQTPRVVYKDASTQTPTKANGLPLWMSGPMMVEEPGLGLRMRRTIHHEYYRNQRLEAHSKPYTAPVSQMTPLPETQPTLRIEQPRPKVKQPEIEKEVKTDIASTTKTTTPVATVPAIATEPHVCAAPATIHHYHRISKRKLSTSELWAMVPLWASLLIIFFFLLFTYFSFTTFSERWMWLRANESARRFVVAWRERGYSGSRGLGMGIGLGWAGDDARWRVGVPGGRWEGVMFVVEQWIGMKRGYYM